VFHAWLGEAIAIQDPTAALFRPQSGCNLMVIGQDDQAALGMLTTAVISLAAQHPPAALGKAKGGNGPLRDRTTPARFYVLDGSPADAPYADLWPHFSSLLPHAVKVASWRDLTGLIAEVAAEVDRRLASHAVDDPAIYLVVYGLQRFRDLRRSEDDFGFSSGGAEKPSTAKQFSNILHEGPALGVHVLTWCDTYNNLQRTIDRPGMREFEIRVLFQMSAADSSNLIDTPLASKIGMHRALYYSEEQGRAEKFRPYAPPPEEWLQWVQKQLSLRPSPYPLPGGERVG
jgi:hypothetical protein